MSGRNIDPKCPTRKYPRAAAPPFRTAMAAFLVEALTVAATSNVGARAGAGAALPPAAIETYRRLVEAAGELFLARKRLVAAEKAREQCPLARERHPDFLALPFPALHPLTAVRSPEIKEGRQE